MQTVPCTMRANAGIAIGPILFVVAILAVLVGALAAGSGGFGSSTADDSNRINSSTLIEPGHEYQNGCRPSDDQWQRACRSLSVAALQLW